METTIDPLAVDAGFAVVHRSNRGGERGRCLLIPPFGVPASSLAVLSDALDGCGFESIRLDASNHVGAGMGSIERFRLSAFADDCARALDRYQPRCVVAISMGARATMRALATTGAPATAVLALPVVDVAATLTQVIGRDWLAQPEQAVPEMVEVLDCPVEARPFHRDCLTNDLATPAGTERDLTAVVGPVHLLPAIDDPWVELGAVERVGTRARAAGTRVTVRPIPGDRHDLHNDVFQALTLVELLVEMVSGLFPRCSTDPTPPPDGAGRPGGRS